MICTYIYIYLLKRNTAELTACQFSLFHSHFQSWWSVHKMVTPLILSPCFNGSFPSFGIDVRDVSKVDIACCLVRSGAWWVFKLQHKELVCASAVKHWCWYVQCHLGAFLRPVAAEVEIVDKRLTLKCRFGTGHFQSRVIFEQLILQTEIKERTWKAGWSSLLQRNSVHNEIYIRRKTSLFFRDIHE